MRLVENDEIVLEQDAAFHFLLDAHEQREKERVIQNQHVGGKNAVARALKETDRMVFAEIGLIKAVGMMLGQPAGLVQAELNASTVVPLGPGTVDAPGVDDATIGARPVPSGFPENGL